MRRYIHPLSSGQVRDVYIWYWRRLGSGETVFQSPGEVVIEHEGADGVSY